MFTDVKGDLFGPKGLFSKNTLTSTIESRAFDAQLEEGIGRALEKPLDLGSDVSSQVQDISSKKKDIKLELIGFEKFFDDEKD